MGKQKSKLSVRRRTTAEYFEKFDQLEKFWKAWRMSLRTASCALTAQIGWIQIKDFSIEFTDQAGGVFVVVIKKKLHLLTKKLVNEIAEKASTQSEIGKCRQCDCIALFNKNEDLRDLASLCHKCYIKGLRRLYKSDIEKQKRDWDAMVAKHRRKGSKYLLQVWIHPIRGGNDYYLMTPFAKKPNASDAKKIAKANHSAIVDDYSVTKI